MANARQSALVIDTADAAERMAAEHICKQIQASLEQFAYGKGQVMLGESWGKLIKACDHIALATLSSSATALSNGSVRQMNLIRTKVMKKWQARHVLPLLKEWADIIGFLNFDQQGNYTG